MLFFLGETDYFFLGLSLSLFLPTKIKHERNSDSKIPFFSFIPFAVDLLFTYEKLGKSFEELAF